MITMNDAQSYNAMVASLFSKMATHKDDLMHAAIGISGEAGELLDAVKKHWVYGKDLDLVNCVEELGDIYFYFTAMRQKLGITENQIRTANIEKLSKRYPAGVFTKADAIARADKDGGVQ